MSEWNFQREETANNQLIPEGTHRIRIKSAKKAVSKNGRDMLALQFEVNGYSTQLYHYIVFMPERPEITNKYLTQFFDSFADIPEGDFNTANWTGKMGACMVKHEMYNGQQSPKIVWFVHRDKQFDLPKWVEDIVVPPVKSSSETNVSGPVERNDYFGPQNPSLQSQSVQQSNQDAQSNMQGQMNQQVYAQMLPEGQQVFVLPNGQQIVGTPVQAQVACSNVSSADWVNYIKNNMFR